MSGAAEFMDQVEWDAEETNGLTCGACDGSPSTLRVHSVTFCSFKD